MSGHAISDPGPRSSGRKLHDYQIEQLTKFKAFAEKMGVPEAIIAQAWLLQNPDVSAILSGPRTVEMLDDTIKAMVPRQMRLTYRPDWPILLYCILHRSLMVYFRGVQPQLYWVCNIEIIAQMEGDYKRRARPNGASCKNRN